MRCIIKECDRKAVTRGLCHSCYLTALKLVKAEETTWGVLEQAGLCGPLMKTPNAFAKAYSKEQPRLKDLPDQMNMLEDDAILGQIKFGGETFVCKASTQSKKPWEEPNREVVDISLEQARMSNGKTCDEIVEELNEMPNS